MDLLTNADMQMLQSPGEPGERVSLFMPTHRFGGDAQTDPLRSRNLLTGVESALAERGMRRSEVEQFLAPASALHQDTMAWKHMSDGLAVYLRPGWLRMFRVPVTLPEVATVGDRFVVGPLLRLLSRRRHFLLLALSQRRVRLLEGSRDPVEELHLGEVPTSLLEVSEPASPAHTPWPGPLRRRTRWACSVLRLRGARGLGPHGRGPAIPAPALGEGVRDYLGNQNSPMVLSA